MSGPLAKKVDRVIGVWDLTATSVTLGGLLILAEELQIIAAESGANRCDLCFLGEAARAMFGATIVSDDKVAWLTTREIQMGGICSICDALDIIDGVCVCQSHGDLNEYVIRSATDGSVMKVWPKHGSGNPRSAAYGNTLFLQRHFAKTQDLPPLLCSRSIADEAGRFLDKYAHGTVSVAVHLKSSPEGEGRSNANHDAWVDLFSRCRDRYNAKFILLGNEEIDYRMFSMANVVVARECGSDLSLDLGLISASTFFMGMSSGPANMAILGGNPYIIFKNPEHDVEQMRLELGTNDRFPFAGPSQRFLRQWETGQLLLAEFERVYNSLSTENALIA